MLYALVGLFHYIFRKKFLAISIGANADAASGEREVLGLSLLHVVRLRRDLVRRDRRRAAGLLVPDRPLGRGDAVLAQRSARAWRSAGRWERSSAPLGVLLSFHYDLPTGATIVCTFGVALVILAVVRVITRSKEDAIAGV